jgi:hypothetical protein
MYLPTRRQVLARTGLGQPHQVLEHREVIEIGLLFRCRSATALAVQEI